MLVGEKERIVKEGAWSLVQPNPLFLYQMQVCRFCWFRGYGFVTWDVYDGYGLVTGVDGVDGSYRTLRVFCLGSGTTRVGPTLYVVVCVLSDLLSVLSRRDTSP